MTEKSEQAVSEGTGQAAAVQTNPKGQAVNLTDLPEFKKWQSAADKRDAERERQLEEQRKQTELLQTQLEQLITDPVAKDKMKLERLQSELERFRAKEVAQQQRAMFSQNWNVPESIFAEGDTSAQMTTKALDYLAARPATGQPSPKEGELQRIADQGGDQVSLTPGAPPTPGTSAETDKRIRELRAVALKGGSAGSTARTEILKLMEQAKQGVSKSAKV
jgi:hypothetical protein